MTVKVLVADQDLAFQRQLSDWFTSFPDRFTPIFVSDGMAAAKKLQQGGASVLVCDLQLPKVDGFGLIDFVNTHCPEVPVVVATSHGRPKTGEILKRKGAAAYFEKPLIADSFFTMLQSLCTRMEDGGTLNGASLDTFAQMVEMEQKTCTLRVHQPEEEASGVLFFRDGEIVHARAGATEGLGAAYEILTWQSVSLRIENQCRITDKRIEADLQAVLLEAMRRKDEKENRAAAKPMPSAKPASAAPDPISGPKTSGEPDMPPLDRLRQMMQDGGAAANGVESIFQDSSWRDLLQQAKAIGSFFEAGNVKACYVNIGESSDSILLADDADTVVAVSPDCKREYLLNLLAETRTPSSL